MTPAASGAEYTDPVSRSAFIDALQAGDLDVLRRQDAPPSAIERRFLHAHHNTDEHTRGRLGLHHSVSGRGSPVGEDRRGVLVASEATSGL